MTVSPVDSLDAAQLDELDGIGQPLDEQWKAASQSLTKAQARFDKVVEEELQKARAAGEDVDDPLAGVRITCGLDGAVRSVTFEPGTRRRLSGADLAKALQQAAQFVSWEAEPLPEPGGEDDEDELRAVLDRLFAADPERDPEHVGVTADKNVTVRYRGPLLMGIELRSTWAATAEEAAIQAAVIEASRAALAPTTTGGW